MGLYKIPLPAVLGMEGAGAVEALGEGVSGFRVGDHVAWAMSRGSYAEYAAVPAQVLVKVPAGLDLRQAAAAMLQGMTAHYLTHSTFPIETRPHRAGARRHAGGTGRLLSQMIKLRGGRVIGTSRHARKGRGRACGRRRRRDSLSRAGCGGGSETLDRRQGRRRGLRRRGRCYFHAKHRLSETARYDGLVRTIKLGP